MVGFTKNKVPYFFMYAKDKKRKQVEAQNTSTVNLLKKIIPDDRIVFENTNVGDFDYKMLMKNPDFVIEDKHQKIIELYHQLDLHKYFFINYEDDKVNNLVYLYQDIARKLTVRGGRIDTVVDTLVKYLYEERDSSYKTTLWESFGHIIVRNLKNNITKPLDDGWVMCDSCGKRVKKKSNRTRYCEECAENAKKAQDIKAIQRFRGKV